MALLICSFVCIYSCQKYSLGLKRKYHPVACSEFLKDYEGHPEVLQREAIKELIFNLNATDPAFTGPLQCFCGQESSSGVPADRSYELLGPKGTVVYKGAVC